jgi:uncharacterized protein YndB with AHSA1/START domain
MNRSMTRTTSFRCSPERLWRALTEPSELSGWLLCGDLVPVVGHRCELSGMGPSGRPERIRCEILAVEDGRRLSMRWHTDGRGQAALVEWIIVPRRGRTLLRIVHREVYAAGRIADRIADADRGAAGLDALPDIAGLDALHALLAEPASARAA